MNNQVHPTLRSALAGIYNTVQEIIGSPLRMSEVEPEATESNIVKEMISDHKSRVTLDIPEDKHVCKMCGEPPTSNGDGSLMDMDYCTECESHTEFVLESELEEEYNEDDERLADQEHRWEADNDR